MLDVKRYKELKAMSHNDRVKIGENLGLTGSNKSSIVVIMAMETRRDHQEISRNIRAWIR